MKTYRLVISVLLFGLMASCGQNVTTIAIPTSTGPSANSIATAGLPTPTPDPHVKAQQDALLYSQDFESGTTDGLNTFGQGNWQVVPEISGNHIYCNQDTSNWWGVHFGTDLWTNYAAELRVKVVTFTDLPFISINSRTSVFSDGYVGALNYAGQYAALKYDPSNQSFGEEPFPVTTNTWYILRLEAAGNQIKFFADDQLIANVNDTQSTKGQAGFKVSPHAQICVDDIRVWALTPDGQIAQLPTKPAPSTLSDPLIIKAQQDALLYSQDFESVTTDGLDTFGQGKWQVVPEISGNHMYCNQDTSDWWNVHFGTDLWTDYAVELRIQVLDMDQFSFVSANSRVNILNDGYSGSLNNAGQNASLSYNPPFQSLGEKHFPVKPKTWYTLRMEAAGDRMKLFADNELISDTVDTKRTQGQAGFTVSPRTRMCVDDIRAWALTSDGQIAQLPAKPAPRSLADRLASHKYPKLYYSNQDVNHINELNTPLYFWDILTFDKQVAKSEWGLLGPSGAIRAQNPNSVILAVQSIQEFFPNDTSETNLDFLTGLKPEWAMQDVYGKPFPVFYYSNAGKTFWSSMINLSTDVNTYIPQFLNQEVMKAGLFDGVFYDGVNETWWQAARSAQDTPSGSGSIDFNRDGKPDTTAELNSAQDEGLQKLLAETRKVFPDGSLITGNGGWDGSLLVDKNATTDPILANLLNGREIEGFLNWEKNGIGWLKSMRAYYLMQQVAVDPKTPFITAYCTGTDYDHLRYALASSLMFDAYFACTNAQTGGAFQTGAISTPYVANWWYDEYSVDLSTGKAVQSLDAKGYLGLPVSEAYNVDDQTETLAPLLANNDSHAVQLAWRRDFQNGIVLVNPNSTSKSVDLKGTLRKILGVHDPQFNDGSSITRITLLPKSGVILLKP